MVLQNSPRNPLFFLPTCLEPSWVKGQRSHYKKLCFYKIFLYCFITSLYPSLLDAKLGQGAMLLAARKAEPTKHPNLYVIKNMGRAHRKHFYFKHFYFHIFIFNYFFITQPIWSHKAGQQTTLFITLQLV